MTKFEELVFNLDNFEYDFDPYGYGDAFADRAEGRNAFAELLSDDAGRRTVIDRLTEIAEEDDEYSGTALDLVGRIRNWN